MSAGSAQPQGQPSPALTAEGIAADSVRIEEEQRGAPGRARTVMGSALIVSAATLVSRVAGLGRDILLAYLFAFSREMDAFFLAFLIPQLFRKLFGEGALASATVPVLSRYRISGDLDATRRYLGTISTLLILGLGAITIAVVVATHLVPAAWFTDPVKYVLFRDYLTVLLPYVVFICLAALQAGTLNCWGRFGLPALVPAIANIGWIVVLVAIAVSPWRDDTGMAVLIMALGVLATGVLQWGAQLPALARLNLLARPRLALAEPGVRETFKAMAPMLFALAVFQVNTFLDQVLAEALVPGDGAVSSFAFASRLFQFPLGLVGVALGTAMFPLMSGFAARNELEKLTASLLNSVRLLAFISLPAAAGLAAVALPVTELLFSGPRSEPEMLQRSALVLSMLCISLPIICIISLLTKAFFAMRDHRTPTRIALVAVAVNLTANVILLQTPLMEAGLALGTAISGAVNLVMLALALRRRLRGTVIDSIRAQAVPQISERLAQPLTPSALAAFPLSIARSLVFALLTGAAAFAVHAAMHGAFGLPARFELGVSVASSVLSGVVVYAGLSLLVKAPEVDQILSLRRKPTARREAA